MFNLEQITKIRSLHTEKIIEFYQSQEAECEQAPLAPWRDGGKIKGSDIYVELQVLTERVRSLSLRKNPDKSSKEAPDNSDVSQGKSEPAPSNTSPSSKDSKTINNNKSKKTPDEDLYDEQRKTKQRESWNKIFQGKGLRLVFKGGAGSGKSFSLSQEVRKRLAKARLQLEDFSCAVNELEIPIFIKASALLTSNKDNITEAVLGVLPNLSNSNSVYLSDWLHTAFETENGKRLFIIVDGLDELPETSQGLFRDRMKQFDEELKSASLVVSCRTMYFDERRDWISWVGNGRTKVVELAPLEEKQQAELIEKILGVGKNSNNTVLGLIKKNHSLSHFCQTPLVMASACWLYSEGELSENTTYSSLYKAVTKKILRGDWKEPTERPKWVRSKSNVQRDADLQDRTDLLSQISWKLFELSPSENRFTLKQWRESFEKAAQRNNKKKIDAIKLLKELELVGMIINAGYDSDHNPCYSFVHRTILEYFAAVGLVNHFEESFWVKTIVKHIWCEKAWFEVIRFVASITEDPTLLLKNIAKETGGPVARTRPLQKLAGICDRISGIITFFLVAFVITSGLIIYNSETVSGQAGESFSQAGQFLKLIGENFVDNLKIFRENPNAESRSIITFITDLVYFLAAEIQKVYPLFREFISLLYDALFELLYILVNPAGQETENQQWILEKLRYLLEWIQYLIPYLVLLVLILWVSETILNWLDKKILYRLMSQKQDDIFRTGLRVQAEVIGHNNNSAENDTRRIVDELLASERSKSLHIHGAEENGGIPEDLLLLTGSNAKARSMLNSYWINILDKRCKAVKRRNRWYQRSLYWYKLILKISHRKVKVVPFTSLDFQKDEILVTEIARHDADKFSGYFYEKLSPKTRRMLADYRKNTDKELAKALATDLNNLLDDASFYDKEQFQKIYLRTETRILLRQNPTEENLRYLNRLLIEDAFPHQKDYMAIFFGSTGIKRRQRQWLKFLRWAAKKILYNSMSDWRYNEDQELFRALRGLFLLPDNGAVEVLTELLEQNILLDKNIALLESRRPKPSFTRLDIFVAKVLAASGSSYGKNKLAEFASWLDRRNKLTPLAIKELSLFDEKQAIRLASVCLKDNWQLDSRYTSVSSSEFSDILLALPFEQVAGELIRLCAEDIQYFHKVLLVEYLFKLGEETCKEWLEKIAEANGNELISSQAREVLERDMNRPWVDGENWMRERVASIKEDIEKDRLDQAAKELDELIGYSYRWWYSPNSKTFTDNIELLASVCDEKLLEAWLSKEGRYHSINGKLTQLAKTSNGKAVEKTLIKWANDPRFDDEDYYQNWRKELHLALGEIGTERTEKVLLDILQKARKKAGFLKRRIDGIKNDRILLAALGKIGSDTVAKEIIHELKFPCSWISYFVAARLLAERDDKRAMEYLLQGLNKKPSDSSWESTYGEEPKLRDFALKFGAKITKVNERGFSEYIAVSESRDLKYRVRV